MRAAARLAALLLAAGCAAAPAGPKLPVRAGQERPQDRRLSDLISSDPHLTQPAFDFETLIGSRTMADDAGWDPLDRQLDLGIAMQAPLLGTNRETLPPVLSGLRWDLGLRYAQDDVTRGGDSLDARTIEATGGLLLEPTDRTLRLWPYVGAGLSLAFTDVEETFADDVFENRDTLTSGYVRGGLRFLFSARQFFGVDLRYLTGGGNDVDGIGATAESMTISFVFGARF